MQGSREIFAWGAKRFLRVWRKQSFSHQKAMFLLPATLRLYNPTHAQVSQNHLQNNCCKWFWDTIIGHSRSQLFTWFNLTWPTQNTAFSCNISRAFSTPCGCVAIFSSVLPSISLTSPTFRKLSSFKQLLKGFFQKVVTGQKFTVFHSQQKNIYWKLDISPLLES